MKMLFRELSKPFKIGSMELKNRIVMAPINNNYTYKGFMTELSADFYISRARGGAGLIIVEATSIDYPRSRTALTPAIDDDQYIPMFRRIAEGVHRYGSKIILQLTHVGPQTRKSITGMTPVAASSVSTKSALYPDLPRELNLTEIDEIIGKFGLGALRAQKAGFDGIELQLGHGYLASSFLSPLCNLRKDKYGGLKGGITFCTNLVKEIKRTCGNDFPVVCRMNGDDFVMSGGTTPVEAQMLASQLEKAGADAINVTAGVRDSELLYTDHTSASPRGGWSYLADRLKKTLYIPVITVKRLYPELAEKILEKGKADLVAFGKPFIADPEFANKLLGGHLDDIVPCTSCCQGCYDVLWTFRPITCMLNPKIGRIGSKRSPSNNTKKDVIVIGGGPAGCEAALAASEKGYNVRLFERNASLGGNYRLCTYSPFKQEMERIFPYFSRELGKKKVTVHTDTEFTIEMLEHYNPDVLIMATGADFKMPDIPGINSVHVMSPTEAIMGARPIGQYVVIWTCGRNCSWTCGAKSQPIPDDIAGLKATESYACAAGYAAVDTAETLAAQGRKVTIVTGRKDIVPGMGYTSRGNLLKRFFRSNIRISNNIKVKEMTPEGILCEKDSVEFHFYADTVIVSTRVEPRRRLIKQVEGRVKQIYCVGDCSKIGNAFTAIHGAYDLVERI